MALTAAQTITLALEAAHSPGKAQQATFLYNSILTELCQTYDFAEARGQYFFNFQPGAVPPISNPGVPESGLWGSLVWGLDNWGPLDTAVGGPEGDIWNALE